MELSIKVEESIHRVATRSSTKNQALEKKVKKDRHRTRSRRLDGSDGSSSNSSFSPETPMQPDSVTPIVRVEKGMEENWISKDISQEVRKKLRGFG